MSVIQYRISSCRKDRVAEIINFTLARTVVSTSVTAVTVCPGKLIQNPHKKITNWSQKFMRQLCNVLILFIFHRGCSPSFCKIKVMNYSHREILSYSQNVVMLVGTLLIY